MNISIVVPNLNYGRYLPECLSSIAGQLYRDFDVVLIDAGSTDGSQQIMRDSARKYGSNWRFFERPGESQIDSIAWGLTLSNGDVQCWLNSDDVFIARDAFGRVVNLMENYPQMDCLSMGGYYIDGDGHFTHRILLQTHPLLTQRDLALRLGIVQPATFWRRKVFQTLGFDRSLRFSFDSDFFLLAAKRFNFVLDQNEMIAGYRLHEANLSLGVKPERIAELALLSKKHHGRNCRSMYLLALSRLVGYCEKAPPAIASRLKKGIYRTNNLIAHWSIYRWPAI
jgi:glycosyltransferase involved in cell wall biosynthesis